MVATERRTRVVRPLRGGQITIPADFRRELGIDEDSLLQVTLEKDELRIRRLRAGNRAGDKDWFGELYQLFAPVRDEAVAKDYTEQEINDLIDGAVAEVRRERRARG